MDWKGQDSGPGTSEEATEVIREAEDIGLHQGGDSSGGEKREKLGHSLEVEWKGQVEGQEVGHEEQGAEASPALPYELPKLQFVMCIKWAADSGLPMWL